MNSVSLLCALGLIVILISGTEANFGCFDDGGKNCIEECPKGTHVVSTGCSRLLPEATCEQPKPLLDEYEICDYVACHCNPPTVRDKRTKKCVLLEQCSKE